MTSTRKMTKAERTITVHDGEYMGHNMSTKVRKHVFKLEITERIGKGYAWYERAHLLSLVRRDLGTDGLLVAPMSVRKITLAKMDTSHAK